MTQSIGRRTFRLIDRIGLVVGLIALLMLLVAATATKRMPPPHPGEEAQDGAWIEAADAPFAFTRFDGEYSTTTGMVYFLGGRLSDGTTDGTIWSFDPLSGEYADTGADMQIPTSNYEIARLIDDEGVELLIAFGGRMEGGGGTDAVQAYRPATNDVLNYEATDPLPIAMSPGAVVVADNVAYVLGGFDGTQVYSQTYIFDPMAAEGARFSEGPDLSQARGYIAGAVVDGFLYAIGGDTLEGAGGRLTATTRVEMLDLANPAAWDDAAASDLPIPCGDVRAYGFDSASDFELAGFIVLAGCGQWPTERPEAMLYDVSSDVWDLSFPDLNEKRRNNALAFVPVDETIGQYAIWVWGGRQGSDVSVLYTPEYFEVNQLPEITVEKTVSDTGTCGPSDTLEVWIGSEVTYCYTMTNIGGYALMTHTVDDDQLGLIGGGTLTITVQPGETISVTATTTPQQTVTNTVVWTAFTADGRSASATDSATVTVLAPDLAVFKGVSDDGSCGETSTISVDPGTEVTYCYVMTNIGNVDLLVHTVEDNRLGLITGGPIVQTVQPGETFSVTATVIVAEPVINTVTWTSETDGGPPAAGTASATVLIGNPYWLYLPVIFGPASIGASE